MNKKEVLAAYVDGQLAATTAAYGPLRTTMILNNAVMAAKLALELTPTLRMSRSTDALAQVMLRLQPNKQEVVELAHETQSSLLRNERFYNLILALALMQESDEENNRLVSNEQELRWLLEILEVEYDKRSHYHAAAQRLVGTTG